MNTIIQCNKCHSSQYLIAEKIRIIQYFSDDPNSDKVYKHTSESNVLTCVNCKQSVEIPEIRLIECEEQEVIQNG